MAPEVIAGLISDGLGVGLVVVGVWFGINKFWPYYVLRDTEERKRAASNDIALANALQAIAAAIDRLPLDRRQTDSTALNLARIDRHPGEPAKIVDNVF